MNIYQKIMLIRQELMNTEIKKSGHNKFAGFKYFELRDFLPITTKLFEQHKLYSRFSIKPATTEQQETATFIIVNSENPEEVETYTLPTAECRIGVKKDGTGGADPIQNLGGTITYLRRYMYLIALDLIEDDAVDSQDNSNKPHKPSQQPRYTNEAEAIKQETLNGLNKIMASLEKPENVEYKPIIVKTICEMVGVDKWLDIKFEGNMTYKKLVEIVKQELEKEKALANANI